MPKPDAADVVDNVPHDDLFTSLFNDATTDDAIGPDSPAKDAPPEPEPDVDKPSGEEGDAATTDESDDASPDGEADHSDDSPDDVETKRYQHWQSKYDEAMKRMKELEMAAPIAEMLRAEPKLLEKLAGVLAGKSEDKPNEPTLTRPERPQAPAGFNPEEAFTNPESESFQHRQKMEKYREDMLEYFDKRDAAREAQLRKQEEERRIADERQKTLAQLRLQATEAGLKPEEFEDFMQTVTGGPGSKVDNLVKYYRQLKGQSTPDKAGRKSSSDMPPPPVSGGGGGAPRKKMSEGEEFSESIIQRANRRRAQFTRANK